MAFRVLVCCPGQSVWENRGESQGGAQLRAQLSHPQGPARAWTRRSPPSCWCPPWPGSPSGPSGASGKGLALLPVPGARVSSYQGDRQAPQAPVFLSAHCTEWETEAQSGAVICSWVLQKVKMEADVTQPRSLTGSAWQWMPPSALGLGVGGGSESCTQGPQLAWPRLGLGEP